MTQKNDTPVIETKPPSSCLPENTIEHSPKNLILCSDGTGNRGGVTPDTNVRRLYQAIDRHGHKDEKNPKFPEQIAFYDDGVGTEDLKWLRLAGGAFGWGLSRNIRELYTFLVKHYQPGDQIFLFGFSRGAFTVRSLAGMIARCGIIEGPSRIPKLSRIKDSDDLAEYVKHTYYAYKYAHFRSSKNQTEKECGVFSRDMLTDAERKELDDKSMSWKNLKQKSLAGWVYH